ncbi:hypothetical protein M446_4159 [Methylobacterium sp. 4-46]|nr:hypothetical protein M446_4159 [Methylobacterium sp. 4-46]
MPEMDDATSCLLIVSLALVSAGAAIALLLRLALSVPMS